MNEALAQEPEDDDQDDDVEPGGGSFFAHHDAFTEDIDDVLRADDAACEAVWRMFVKDSNGRGFNATSRAARKVSAWRKANPGRGMQAFGIVKGSGEMREKIVQAHADLTAKHGRPPTVEEVRKALGGSTTATATYQSLKRYALPFTSMKGRKAPPPAAKAEAKPALVKLPPKPKAPEPAPAAPTREGGIFAHALGLLRAELAVLERDVETLRKAIATLEGRP